MPGKAPHVQRCRQGQLGDLESGPRQHIGQPLFGRSCEIELSERLLDRDLPGAHDADQDVVRAIFESRASLRRKAADIGEAEAGAEFAAENQKEIARQAAGGIQTIKLDGAAAETYRAKAYQAGWDGIIRQSPESGPKLREFFSKAK